MRAPKILAFSGSLRKESLNHKLCVIAAAGVEKAGGQCTVIRLADYELPVYNQDIEDEQTPDNVLHLKRLFREHDALLIGSPEYNSSISGSLKNVIDWVSRPQHDDKQLECFDGKAVALMTATPSFMGGVRGQIATKSIFSHIKAHVLPDTINLSDAPNQFDDQGNLKDPKQQEKVVALGEKLTQFTTRLIAPL